jgi:hypothetical protein
VGLIALHYINGVSLTACFQTSLKLSATGNGFWRSLHELDFDGILALRILNETGTCRFFEKRNLPTELVSLVGSLAGWLVSQSVSQSASRSVNQEHTG